VPTYLKTILELLLNYLVSLSIPHDAAPVEELVAVLIDEHEVPRQVAIQVMSWFGDLHSGKWSLDVNAVTKEIGLGILREHKVFNLRFLCWLKYLLSARVERTILSHRVTSSRNGEPQ
jgi:hypothetical protein